MVVEKMATPPTTAMLEPPEWRRRCRGTSPCRECRRRGDGGGELDGAAAGGGERRGDQESSWLWRWPVGGEDDIVAVAALVADRVGIGAAGDTPCAFGQAGKRAVTASVPSLLMIGEGIANRRREAGRDIQFRQSG